MAMLRDSEFLCLAVVTDPSLTNIDLTPGAAPTKEQALVDGSFAAVNCGNGALGCRAGGWAHENGGGERSRVRS